MIVHSIKKTAALLLAVCLTVTPVSADEMQPQQTDLALDCRSAILIEQNTGQVLYEENADEPMAPASITKIMTLLLTFEAMEQGKFGLDTPLTCSEHAASMGGSQIWMEVGETMTVDEILRATFISSANDAAVVLAEAVAGSEEAFVSLMNQKAAQLGMKNTHFQNATGLDAPEHYSTARDIAVMSAALLHYPGVTDYSTVWMDSLRDGATQLVNTNKLVRFYDGATGLKTGTTDGAGSCLAASAKRGELSLVAVSLGSDTSAQRFSACRTLLDYGFANYISAAAPPAAQELTDLPVAHGVRRQVSLRCEMPDSFILKKEEQNSLSHEIRCHEGVEAPVRMGQTLGEVTVLKNGETLGVFPLTAAEEVEKMDFPHAAGVFFGALIGIEPQF